MSSSGSANFKALPAEAGHRLCLFPKRWRSHGRLISESILIKAFSI